MPLVLCIYQALTLASGKNPRVMHKTGMYFTPSGRTVIAASGTPQKLSVERSLEREAGTSHRVWRRIAGHTRAGELALQRALYHLGIAESFIVPNEIILVLLCVPAVNFNPKHQRNITSSPRSKSWSFQPKCRTPLL